MNADPTQMNADVSRERLNQLSHRIIGAAHRVSNTLGYGFLEKVYENALLLELQCDGLDVQQQYPIQVSYRGRVVGDYIPDLLVEHCIVVEIKATVALDKVHQQQCLNYMRATGYHLSLLLNFGRPLLEVKRIVWNF